jgi:hypothetical protein
MPLASQRVLTIIFDECKNRDQRFPGYHKELISTLSDIIQLERDHRVQGTNIRQRVADKIDALGRLIADSGSKKQDGPHK